MKKKKDCPCCGYEKQLDKKCEDCNKEVCSGCLSDGRICDNCVELYSDETN